MAWLLACLGGCGRDGGSCAMSCSSAPDVRTCVAAENEQDCAERSARHCSNVGNHAVRADYTAGCYTLGCCIAQAPYSCTGCAQEPDAVPADDGRPTGVYKGCITGDTVTGTIAITIATSTANMAGG